MQIDKGSLYNNHVGIICVQINCIVKEMNFIEMQEMKNDIVEEWCMHDACLFNWLILHVCINECVKEVKEG